MATLGHNQQLSSSELFAGCVLDDLDFFSKTFSKGQFIADRVGEELAVGFIVNGIIDVYSLAEDGTEIKLSELHTGECFGICNVLVPSALETVLKCRSKTQVLFISKTSFTHLMTTDPAFAMRYGALCNRKIQFLLKRIELLTMQSCRSKLIAYLLDGGKETITLPDSKEQLAKMLGVSRAALFRELAYLQNAALIQTHAATITILNQEKLRQLLWR